MRSRQAYLVYLVALLGVLLSIIIRERFDGVAFLMVLVAGAAFFIANHLEKRERAPYPPLCSTCGQPVNTHGCSTSPESKFEYPHGFHTISGGVAANDAPYNQEEHADDIA